MNVGRTTPRGNIVVRLVIVLADDTVQHVLRTFNLSITVISSNFCGIPHYLWLLGQPVKHFALGISRKHKTLYDRNRAKAKTGT